MSTTRIIVVEDEAIVAADLEECLTRLGYEVPAVVSRGDQAIEKADQLKPDLILMDIILDGDMDGIEAAEIIQNRFEIPILYLTAHADSSTLERAKKTAPFGYILKPFQDRELLSSIEVAICRDRMEKRIKKLSPWLKAILNGIGDGVIATDKAGIVTFINPAAEALTGWKCKEILGMNAVEVLDIEDWETGEPIGNLLLEILKLRKVGEWNKNVGLISVDGSKHPIEHYCAPIFDDNGTISGGLIVIRDAAECKRAEAEKSRIQTTVQEMQKLETLGMMAGGIAHNLNNILTTIIGHTQLARGEISPNSSAIFNLDQIEKVAMRAVDLNKKILSYSLKGHRAIKRINLNKIVRDIDDLLPWSLGEKISIHYRLAKELPTILADPIEIRQVVVNLALNAIESVGDKRGTIVISTDVIHADIATLRGFYPSYEVSVDDYVSLEIQDDGCGISDKSRTQIFDPFYTTKASGNGLGLTAVLNILRRYKGTIKVQSEPGRRSMFKVLIPMIRKTPIDEPKPAVAPAQWRASGSILIVDDEESVCTVTSEYLKSIGFNTIIANNGFDALNLFAENAQIIKCVILDFYRPGKGGEETFRKLREIKKDVRVLVMSGILEKEDVNHFFDKGLAGFLQKPFAMEEFRNKIWEIVKEPA